MLPPSTLTSMSLGVDIDEASQGKIGSVTCAQKRGEMGG